VTQPTKAVADAYYVLSDSQRRSDYDQLSSSKSSSERANDPNASNNFFRMFSGMFTNSAAGNGPSGAVPGQPDQRPNADQVFGDVFEDVRHSLSCPRILPSYVTTHPPFFFLFFPFRYSFYGLKLSGISRCGPG
jgi:curved DNA-binding protein CbpA